MRRHLVIANQTLLGSELLGVMRARSASERSRFFVVVPMRHPGGPWSEGSAHATAEARLAEALERFRAEGLDVDGTVGDTNPVAAAGDALLADGDVDEIIVSTLPHGTSFWIGQAVPQRIAREHPAIPVTHVVSELAHAV
jgi:hypothetical protein